MPELEVIASLDDCRNGSCCTIWRLPTGGIRVRGKDPQDPSRELEVHVPAADWAVLAPQLLTALQG